MRRFEKVLVMLLALAVFVLQSRAQNGINSPYSRYGIGQLTDQAVGVNKAMGGIGIGLRDRNMLNTLNPASYSTVDTLTFLLDFGFSLTNGNFKENGNKVNARNARVDYVAMQFRLFPKVGLTAAFMPVSGVGYSFSEKQNVRNDEDGQITSTNTFGGTGGFRRISLGLGWAPFKWLSVGADVSYMMGDMTHVISNEYSETSIFKRTKTYYSEINGVVFDAGLQSQFNLGKGILTLGVTGAPALNMNDESLIYSQVLNGTAVESADTVYYGNQYRLPARIGAGLSYSFPKWMVGADVAWEGWGDSRMFDPSNNGSGRNRLKVSLGGMYRPNQVHNNIFLRSSYRAGVFYNQPYFNMDGMSGPVEYGASVGVSLPVMNRWNTLIELNVSGQYVHVSAPSEGMISENYLRLNIGLAFNERWFDKLRVR